MKRSILHRLFHLQLNASILGLYELPKYVIIAVVSRTHIPGRHFGTTVIVITVVGLCTVIIIESLIQVIASNQL